MLAAPPDLPLEHMKQHEELSVMVMPSAEPKGTCHLQDVSDPDRSFGGSSVHAVFVTEYMTTARLISFIAVDRSVMRDRGQKRDVIQ